MHAASPTIRASGLTKRFGKLTAVSDVSLEVGAGEVFGFLGPNGAGKTTTIRMLSGLVRPTSGSALVAGYDVSAAPLEVKRRVGYLAETPYLYPKLTGREFLAFMGGLYDVRSSLARQRAERLLSLFELGDKADALVETYSHGMRQKLALAGALLHEPPVLFLDEPTSGLDPRSARLVKDLLVVLVERGHTVFLSTHVLEIAEHLCHRVGIIDHGQVIATGTLDELRHQTHVEAFSLEDVFLQLTGGTEERELANYLRDT
ncbi:MAG TPA: ABC transporter ATP-binding protein [Chloroflexota bacterium]|jgi:ABC-2 type transport system ATP-binding protein|nr:ABC transporter ATP-binding protein [Chloroflexota bacterium]